jgi:hypothetical protein
VEVAGCQVGTVGGVVQELPTEGDNMVDHRAAVWRLASSNTLVRPSRNCWHHRHTICIDMTSGLYTCTRRLAGHALFRSVFTTALLRHRLRDEGRTSHNKRGRLHVDTTQ